MNSLQRNERRDRDIVLEEELQRIRIELTALRKIIDTFAGVFLNSAFPYGKPVDRWRQR